MQKFIYLGEKEESGHYVYFIPTGRISKISDYKYKKLRSETRAVSISRPNNKENLDVDKLTEYISWYGKVIDTTEQSLELIKYDLKWFDNEGGYLEQIHVADGLLYGIVNNEDNVHKLRKRFGEDLELKAIGDDIYLFQLKKRITENQIGLLMLDIGFVNNFRGKNILEEKKRTLSYYMPINISNC